MSPRSTSSRRHNSSVRLLLGQAHSTAMANRQLHPSLLAAYRLRVVAVGVLIMAMALINGVIYLILNTEGGLESSGFLGSLALGIVTLGGVVLTPWSKVLTSKHALSVLYGWSVVVVALINVGVYFDGGGQSVIYLMLPIITVFFAIAYPQRVQALLYVVTVGLYTVAIAATGWDMSAAEYFMRASSLAILGYVASVLSGWLVAEMHDRVDSTTAADQRAGMLDTVARAARRISSLDASHVLGGALSGAMELGCTEAEIWLMDGSPASLTLQRRIAMELASPNEEVAIELYERARVAGATQITEAGDYRLLACLLHREGNPAGVLLVKVSEADSEDFLLIECIELLAAQVSAGLDVARNVAERRGLEERLAHWAFHDALTDLPNRVLFADRLELALARTARDASKVAVLFLDLDNFKTINDTFGHGAGDELLTSVATRLLGCLRPNDTLARYGGDEFVVLVEQIDEPDAALVVAQRILDALERPVLVAGRDLLVRTSIGIAMTGARLGADSDVLRRADMAMYQAKATGGSCYVLSKPTSEPQASVTE